MMSKSLFENNGNFNPLKSNQAFTPDKVATATMSPGKSVKTSISKNQSNSSLNKMGLKAETPLTAKFLTFD